MLGGSNELLNGERPLPAGFAEEPIGHVQAYTFGYDRDFDLIPHCGRRLGDRLRFMGCQGCCRRTMVLGRWG